MLPSLDPVGDLKGKRRLVKEEQGERNANTWQELSEARGGRTSVGGNYLWQSGLSALVAFEVHSEQVRGSGCHGRSGSEHSG